MATNICGVIEQFEPAKAVFSEYKERLDFYFEANEVEDDDKKRAIFFTVIGPNQFSLLRDLCAPAKIKDKSYSDLCDLMKKHHEPTPPKYLQRTKFEARVRKDGESAGVCSSNT
jgi:hypothetical protein